MSVMENTREASADPHCNTADSAKKQPVRVEIDGEIADALEHAATRLDTTVLAIMGDALSAWLHRLKIADGQRAVAEHFAEASFTDEQITEADAWFDGVQAEAKRMLAEDRDAEDPAC